MSVLTALAKAEAFNAQRAQPIVTVRHAHVSDRPLILVPLMLAGEANAPLAALVGNKPDNPVLLVVPEPRNRDERFAFTAALAVHVLSYLESFAVPMEMDGTGKGLPADAAPQLWVPNHAGVRFLQLLGRSTRFRRTEGPYAVLPGVPLFGRWMTFFTERAPLPGSCLLMSATGVLSQHWATGQSALEDGNLAALIAWIDPPDGTSAVCAARVAEDPLAWPPAGPATDPTFDNEVLAPAIAAFERAAGMPDAEAVALANLKKILFGQVAPTWRLMWRAVELMRRLPAGASVADRWLQDRHSYSEYARYVVHGLPQPRRDGAVAAARRLDRMERRQAEFEAQRAFDDPLVMAEHRMVGEAFRGTVIHSQPDRVDTTGPRRKLRPRIVVRTGDPVRLEAGTRIVSPIRPMQKALLISVTMVDSGYDIMIELAGGMGRSLTPAPGSVPDVGDQLTYTSNTFTYQPTPTFPAVEETPWTHGGPPQLAEPDADDATEAWS